MTVMSQGPLVATIYILTVFRVFWPITQVYNEIGMGNSVARVSSWVQMEVENRLVVASVALPSCLMLGE